MKWLLPLLSTCEEYVMKVLYPCDDQRMSCDSEPVSCDRISDDEETLKCYLFTLGELGQV